MIAANQKIYDRILARAERIKQRNNELAVREIMARYGEAQPKPAKKASAQAQWRAEVDKRIQQGMTKSEATREVGRNYPELRQQMLDEVNGRQ